MKSVCLRTDRPLDGARLTGWLQRMLAERGQDLLRTKGILSIAGQDKQFVVPLAEVDLAFTETLNSDLGREFNLR